MAQCKGTLEKDGEAYLNAYLIMGSQGVAYQTAQAAITFAIEKLEIEGFKISFIRNKGYRISKEWSPLEDIKVTPGITEPKAATSAETPAQPNEKLLSKALKEAREIRDKKGTFYDFAQKWAKLLDLPETKVMEIVTAKMEGS